MYLGPQGGVADFGVELDPVHQQCLEFVNTLMHTDPAKRPSAKQALRHPFLSGKTRAQAGKHLQLLHLPEGCLQQPLPVVPVSAAGAPGPAWQIPAWQSTPAVRQPTAAAGSVCGEVNHLKGSTSAGTGHVVDTAGVVGKTDRAESVLTKQGARLLRPRRLPLKQAEEALPGVDSGDTTHGDSDAAEQSKARGIPFLADCCVNALLVPALVALTAYSCYKLGPSCLKSAWFGTK